MTGETLQQRMARLIRDAGHDPEELAALPLDPEAPYVTCSLLSDVVPRRQEWVWDKRIPTRAISMLVGREGTGKSTVAARLIADLTRGTLPGDLQGTPQHVLLLGMEDDMEQAVWPRFVAAGADLTRIHKDPRTHRLTDADGRHARFDPSKPLHRELLGRYIKAKGITFLYLDSFQALVPPGVSILSPEVRVYTSAANDWAQQLDISILAAWHTTKGSGRSVDKVQGNASGTTGVARSVLYLVERPDTEETTVVVAVTKSNVTSWRKVPPVTTEIQDAVVQLPDGSETETGVAPVLARAALPDGCLHGKDYVDLLLEQAYTQDRQETGVGTAQGALVWLQAYLLDRGPTRKRRVMADAIEAGHTLRTMERAAAGMDLKVTKAGKEAVWELRAADDDD